MAWNGQVVTTQRTWLSKVLEADPDFFAKRKDEKLYEFSNGKQFRGDPRKVATAYPDE
jgi:hypothetical protein